MRRAGRHGLPRVWMLLASILLQGIGSVQADPEIMVHENDLTGVGRLTSTLHLNHALRGDARSREGTWPVQHLTNVMGEFATGLASGWEVGVHLPVMRAGVDSANSREGQWGSAALMLRLKHIIPLAGGYFVGFNAELDRNARRYVPEARGAEFRAILGLDRPQYRLTLNPHLMWGWGPLVQGHQPDFNVDAKALWKVGPGLAWGAELYSDWGKAERLQPGQGDRTLYLVCEKETALGAVHVGVGKGFRETPERTMLKLVWASGF